MGIMKKISVLCEIEDKKGLIDLLNTGELPSLTNKTPEEIADEFINAHRIMRANRNNEEYKHLNKIHDKMQGVENERKK